MGIVGLPNVGKSTLFNALLKKQQALAANYPFATVEPNTGVVPVPDARLQVLAEVVAASSGVIAESVGSKERLTYTQLPPIVPATVTFLDIAGIVAGAHKGEGLGNQFLAYIREVDTIAFVVRAFSDPDVVETGSGDFGEDLVTVKTELIMKDMEAVEAQKDKLKGNNKDEKLEAVYKKIMSGFDKGQMVRDILDLKELELVEDLHLLTVKPVIYVVNVGEEQIKSVESRVYAERLGVSIKDVVLISAKMEAEVAALSEQEQGEYLAEYGLEHTGLERLIRTAYFKLRLVSFLTAGEKEVRAWTVIEGATAREAASVIHTDFGRNFIKADVISYDKFVECGGWKRARELGTVRSEGRDYLMKDGDVVEFKVGV